MQRDDSSDTPKLPYIGSVSLVTRLADEADGDYQVVVVSVNIFRILLLSFNNIHVVFPNPLPIDPYASKQEHELLHAVSNSRAAFQMQKL